MKLTNQRQIILEFLKSTKSHPSAKSVYLHVKKKLPRISLGTVYRNLNLLTNNNTIDKIDLENKEIFDGNEEKHDHLICKNCKKIFDIDKMNFSIDNFQPTHVQIYGICKNC
jgi:Fe2+ or Zn2+ uptake regulation protein